MRLRQYKTLSQEIDLPNEPSSDSPSFLVLVSAADDGLLAVVISYSFHVLHPIFPPNSCRRSGLGGVPILCPSQLKTFTASSLSRVLSRFLLIPPPLRYPH